MSNQYVSDEPSLQEIEGLDWGDPETGETDLVSKVLRYRRLPLSELGTDELRELILQQVSLPILIPRAIRVLESDSRAAGDLYPGDLLSAVLLAKQGFWPAHPELADQVEAIIARLEEDREEVDLSSDIAAFRAALAELPEPQGETGVVTFNHVIKVRQAQRGLVHRIAQLERLLSDTRTTAAQRPELEVELAEAREFLAHTEQYVPRH